MMAEKRVSVRLAAEGGKQVKAEMIGIGDAGAKGFKKISKEAEAANRKLAAFARAAKFAAVAAAGAALAAGVAMVRSGLQTIDAQANLAQSLDTTTRSIQVLTFAGDLAGVSMGEIEQASKKLTTRLSEAAGGTGTAVDALKRLHLTAAGLQALPLDQRIVAIQDALARLIPPAERAAVASALFGDKAALAFSRIDSATLRQAAKDVRDFGVVVSEQDAAQIQTTNDAISRLGLVWRGLANQLTVAVAPAMEAVANAMASATRVGGVFQTSIGFLGRNLGEMASIAGAFAAFFAGRFVWAMGAAALGLRGVTTGLVALKGALIRTGIGALIVGVGELAYRLNLFGDAAVESNAAQTRMNEALGLYAQIGGPNARAEAIASTQAYLDSAVAKLADAEATLAQMRAKQTAGNALLDQNPMTAGGNSGTSDAMAANVAAASAEVIKLQDELTQARARLKELETADPASPLNAATNAANGLTGALAGASGQASALAQFLSRLPGALAGAASNIAGLRAGIATLSGGGDAAAASVAKYRAELEASLKDVLAATPFEEARLEVLAGIEQKVRLFEQEQKLSAEYQTQVAALAEVAGAASGAGAAGAAAGAAAAKGAEVAKHGWEAVTSTLADYAASARDIGADIGNSLVGAFQSAETAIGNFVRTGKLDFSDLITSMIADLAKLAARQFILGPIANVLSGALGNVGGIVAGVQHAGGTVGGAGPGRMVPAMAFAGAPRMHGGGFAGLRPDEVPAILQRGERVLSRREVTGSSAPIVNVTIMARDAASFRQSRTQVAADIARAVSLGRRGM